MDRKTNASKKTPQIEGNLDEQIYDALLEKGWIIPQTEEDVRQVEAYLEQESCAPTPPEIADPYAIIHRLDEIDEEESSRQPLELPGQRGAQLSPTISPAATGGRDAAAAGRVGVSLLAELRGLTSLPATQIAQQLDVPVTFLADVGRHPKVVPISWRRELDARSERKLGTAPGVVMNALEHPYQAQMAASRDAAYDTEELTLEKMLNRSGMDGETKRFWMLLASEG